MKVLVLFQVKPFRKIRADYKNGKMNLNELVISDGHIVKIVSKLSCSIITLVDWKENFWSLTFMNVIAIESFNPEGEELDRIEISSDDSLIHRARAIAREPDLPVSCYSFFSAWSDESVLRIVANDCKIHPVNESPKN